MSLIIEWTASGDIVCSTRYPSVTWSFRVSGPTHPTFPSFHSRFRCPLYSPTHPTFPTFSVSEGKGVTTNTQTPSFRRFFEEEF